MEKEDLKPEVISLASTFSPQVIAIAAFLFAALLVIVYVVFNKRQLRSKGNALLLLGPSEAGKTAIFSRLVFGHSTPTHASLQTNASTFEVASNKAVRIIDVPGHPRIRGQFADHLSDAKAIVFVVDCNTISRNGAAAAEHLHTILHAITSLPPSQPVPALAIACNKADLLKTSASSGSASTLAINRVKTILERELEKRRIAQTGGVGVEGLGEEGEERSEMGGLECGDEHAPFRFDRWEGGEITFLGTSVRPEATEKLAELDEKSGPDGLAPLQEWLEEQL